METRVAVMGIIVENTDSVSALNELLHTHAQYIIGRMGIPYREKSINISKKSSPRVIITRKYFVFQG